MPNDSLRLMTRHDLALVLQWRNHPDVRRYMYTNHEIDMNEHQAWFVRASGNPDVKLLIYEHKDQPLGFVNLTRTRSPSVADWGFYLAPNAPKGTGRSLGRRTLDYAFADMELHKVCGQALGFNERSIAFHKALGFVQEGRLRQHHSDGQQYHDVLCFGLLEPEWQSQKKE